MAIVLNRSFLISLTLYAALAVSGTVLAGSGAASTGSISSLQVQRHGDHGRAVILIPGLEGGPWVWQQTVKQLQKNHVVYVVTLAGFDGVPAPTEVGNLFDRADAELLKLIKQRHIDKPVLVGHSLGGTLALRFAGEHAGLISGVVAVDGLPILPGMERASAEQRQAMATRMQQKMSIETPTQFQAQSLVFMQNIGVIDPKLAARYAPMNARSDIKASAQYMAEDLTFDGRAGLKSATVPILEISPYYAADFSTPRMVMSEAKKAAYYQSLLADAPNAKVVSIAPSRHYVMLDQPVKFQQTLDGFLKSL